MPMNQMHEEHLVKFMEDSHNRSLYDSWWVPGTVNYWRHTRLLAPVLEVLADLKKYTWLTVGDGPGTDAWRLLQAGFEDVLATDLDDTLLRQTKESGRINKYKIENGESLSFPDNSFDFILCKEALHHMSRPYSAIYEFLRVARYGVVVIEPQDTWIDWPCRTDAASPNYEAVGNFVYQFSHRELAKIAYGLNLRGVATRNLVDVYLPGCEFAHCVDNDSIWQETRTKTDQATKAMQEGTIKPNYVQGIFFKDTVAPELFDLFTNKNPDWRFLRTDTNVFLNAKRQESSTTSNKSDFISKKDTIIPPEIKNDEFYNHIKLLSSTENFSNVLEIGSSSGQGSTDAFVTGFLQNPHKPSFYCMEISKSRFESLNVLSTIHDFVHCFNVSSVPLAAFPTKDEVIDFYNKTPTMLNHYPLEQVLLWLHEDTDFIATSGVPQNGIQIIKQQHGISTFDLVLIDGSEFTGKAELEEVYGARFILLDDINAFKNYENYHRLKNDPAYEIYVENWQLRNGYAIFKKR